MAGEGAKRLRLDRDAHGSRAQAEAELAALLQKLQGLLGAGGEPGGLDSLLEELVRAQAGLRGSSQADVAAKAIEQAQEKLQAAIVVLQAAVDRFTPPPGYCPPPSAGVDEVYVRGLLSYAHRLSYSSSAPLGYQPGQPLYFFKPPAPQEAEMRLSQLHAFNADWEKRQQLLDAQQQATARGTAAAPAAPPATVAAAAAALPAQAAAAAALPAGGDLAAMAAKLGLDLQQLLASMPPGWKPGDPISLGPAPPAAAEAAPAAPAAPAAVAGGAQQAAVPAPAAQQQPAQQQQQEQQVEPATEAAAAGAAAAEEAEAPPAPRLAGIFLNQLNFADLEYGVSSGEDDSDEDDSDAGSD